VRSTVAQASYYLVSFFGLSLDMTFAMGRTEYNPERET
jgi:hypothetical protein